MKSTNVKIPIPLKKRRAAERTFNFIQKKLGNALTNLGNLRRRTAPSEHSRIQKHIKAIKKVYHGIDKQRMTWLPYLRSPSTNTKTVRLPNSPIRPFGGARRALGLYDRPPDMTAKEKLLATLLDRIEEDFVHLKNQKRSLPRTK